MLIRAETPEDQAAIRNVNELAFAQPNEANLVDALRVNCPDHISLVAEVDGSIVGHVFFSPVQIGEMQTENAALGLGPLAVLPAFQNQGIGSQLVTFGLDVCRALGTEIVVVLGHPNYYPRFGFTVARESGLTCEYPVPDEAFMVAELKDGSLSDRHGLVRYRPEFNSV
jgi:putative acetyltransferase